MIKKEFIEKLKGEYDQHEIQRRQIISASNIILHSSKRVIFSLHRGDETKAIESLMEIEKTMAELEEKFGFERLREEGSYKACVEEYVEAKMFYLVVTGGVVEPVAGLQIDNESYLGGICDLTGEMVRLATNKAANGKFDEVTKIKQGMNSIMAELVEFDMAGYLRTKYDQAKSNLRKIEQMDYEIKLKTLK